MLCPCVLETHRGSGTALRPIASGMTGRSVAQRQATQRCSPNNEFEDAEVLIHQDPQRMESVPDFLRE